MSVKYNISQLLALSSVKTIQTALYLKVNDLLTAKNEVEYTNALRDATAIASDYTESALLVNSDKSQFGFPVYMPTIISGAGQSLFLESAICNLEREKRIVVTDVDGLDISVKECINNGDFLLEFSGFIANKSWIYPMDAVIEFNELMKLKQPLKIEHPLLNALDIFEMVVTGYNLPSTEFTNLQPYTFSCLNDEPVELTLE